MMEAQPLDLKLPLSVLGEGAFWQSATSSLYWVDISGRRVHRYDLASKVHEEWLVPKEVSFAYPSNGGLTLCLSDGVYDFDLTTGRLAAIATLDLPEDHRLNDGKLDPEGRLWVGTINTAEKPIETAALYVLRGTQLQEVEGGYVNANGKAWSPHGKTMYHADTSKDMIWQYNYDANLGLTDSRRVFAKNVEGHPDGLCTDKHGNVYAAIYAGSRIEVFSPSGDLIRSIALPVPNPTSCVIGGSGYDTLFITTAREGMIQRELAHAPLSGQIFVAKLGQ